MKHLTLLPRLIRLCFSLAGCCTLFSGPAAAKIELDPKLQTGSTNYDGFSHNGRTCINGQSFFQLLNGTVKNLSSNMTKNSPAVKFIDVYTTGVSIADIYNNPVSPIITLKGDVADSNEPFARGVTSSNGETTLFSQGLAAATEGRWLAMQNQALELPPPLNSKENTWKDQIASTLFHEMGHQFVRRNYTVFIDRELPSTWRTALMNIRLWIKRPLSPQYKNEVLKGPELKVLDEAFAVYCQFLYYKHISNRKNLTVKSFMEDSVNNHQVEYGIPLEYMWMFAASLNYNAATEDDVKPRKDLYEAYQDAAKRGDDPWAKTNDIQANESAKNNQSKVAFKNLLKSQVQTMYLPMLPPLPPAGQNAGQKTGQSGN